MHNTIFKKLKHHQQQQHQQHQQQHEDSPQRPLGRDYHNRRLGDIDPRSTISMEEDRLRGSLIRLEQRLGWNSEWFKSID